MKIAIHHREGSFSERWINYCKNNYIPYKIVNCYDNDIIEQLSDCSALMWHHHHANYKDALFAKQLLFSVAKKGLQVFPDFNSNWHFDDKVGQKYLLESIEAPLVPTYVFYDKKSALSWAQNVSFPKVFKLRGGAGSANVKLVKSHSQCVKLINKAFSKGFSQFDPVNSFNERIRKFKKTKNINEILKGFYQFIFPPQFSKMYGNEKGYIYFQEFIPQNDSDIRVIVVGNKAFAIKRMVRENDFRASGSGLILYNKEYFDENVIKLSFDLAGKLESDCVAFDFIFLKGEPMVVEISYGFKINGYDDCVGFWDSELNWHDGKFNPQEWMVEDLVKKIKI